MKKFELTTDSIDMNGVKLYRIKALISFGNVKAGDLGGYVEKENNLSHEGMAWVYGNAEVSGNARVYGNAEVYDDAEVYGNAEVSGNARVYGNAEVYGNAWVYGNAEVYGNAWVSGNAEVYGDARVYDDAEVYGNAEVSGNAWVSGNADYVCFKGFGSKNRNTTMFRTKNGDVEVSCGCFHGTLQEFEDKVKETHGNGKFAREYLACIEVAKIHFEG